jgi:nucleoside-diphosphate kinase
MKTKQATPELLEQHYKDLVDKPFFPKLKEYMLSGPVVCMIWEGKEAVSTGRKMLGYVCFTCNEMIFLFIYP